MTTAVDIAKLQSGVTKVRAGMTPAEMRQHIKDVCGKYDYDPLNELIALTRGGYDHLSRELRKIAAKKTTTKTDRETLLKTADLLDHFGPDVKDCILIHKEILSYIAPKLRAMEVHQEVDANININITKFAGSPIDVEHEEK